MLRKRFLLSNGMLKQEIAFGQQISPRVNVERTVIITKAVTSLAFTPIVPHLATEYDTIFTCMKNFQDVLQQKHLNYGSLWCN